MKSGRCLGCGLMAVWLVTYDGMQMMHWEALLNAGVWEVVVMWVGVLGVGSFNGFMRRGQEMGMVGWSCFLVWCLVPGHVSWYGHVSWFGLVMFLGWLMVIFLGFVMLSGLASVLGHVPWSGFWAWSCVR